MRSSLIVHFAPRPLRLARTIAVTLTILAPATGTADAQDVTLPASDGEIVHGTWFRIGEPPSAVILAFHQGGASGVAEYGPIAARLNREGYDVLAIDQRSGGDRFGGLNRTVEARGGEAEFCEAAADLEGALQFAREYHGDKPIVLWGSSYSAALVVRLAATLPEGVIAVLAFSPAGGEPMADCHVEEILDRIQIPVLALWPRSEMELDGKSAQVERFRQHGHSTYIADPGVHGSSMLVDERVDGPVEETWEVVLGFLRDVNP